jgi:PKD repeat protein/photosystem II stability/assembly factor-like uncharacterized protein
MIIQKHIMNLRSFLCLLFVVFSIAAIAQPAVGPWSNTGPILFPVNMTGQVDGMGRVSQIKFHPTNPLKMYAVSASGGLFISNNNGVNWAPTHGTELLPTTACSSVCIDYTDDNILYLSTGDANYYNEDFGIWKSVDAGYTWNPANTNIGNRMAIEILMDPTNHNNLVAATDDGVWRTTNAGLTWTETIVGGAFKSMQRRPGSNHFLYAATATLFYRSNNFGVTWTNITSGVVTPSGNEGIRIAVTPADTNLVFLGTTGGYGEIMKSIDGGATFANIYTSTTQCIVCYDSAPPSSSQGYYNFNLTVNPVNPNELLLVSHCVWRSTDGGLTWSWRTQWWHQVHTDMHDIQFNPYNVTQRFNANDGGVWLSTDPLATLWNPRSTGLTATEVYHAAQSPLTRQMISMGTQDNGELYFDGVWRCNRGGDWGSRNAIDYLGNETVYYSESGKRRALAPLGGDNSFNSPFVPNNNAQIEFVPSAHNVVFAGKDSLWRSTDINIAGPTWTYLYTTGGPTIKGIASCRGDNNILYFVTDNGHLYRSDNAMAPTPAFIMLSTPGATNVMASVATDKYNANVVYLTCNSSVYRSANKGVTWANITSTLPSVNIIKVIADEYSTNERLFLAEGNTVYFKDNTTTAWTNTAGLPSVSGIRDLMIYNDSTASSVLRISTYGRGVWEANIHNNIPPVASFISDKQNICPGDTVHFYKNIFGNSTSFLWSFPGGVPATSTLDSPIIVYAVAGTYNAALTAFGPAGNDTVTRVAYIVVSNGSPFSLVEGFEGAGFPPLQWSLASASGHDWQQTTAAGGFGLSAHSMEFNNFDNDGGGKHDKIICPKIDLTYSDSAYITFDVAYAFYPGYHDSLHVEISTDCGRTFTSIYEKDSTILATAPNATSAFTPTAAQWRKDTIRLTSYLGSGDIELAFDNIGHYGQNIYIDNVNIHVTTSPTLGLNPFSNDGEVRVFPNPAKGIINLTGTSVAGNSLAISCFNIAGSLVAKKTVKVDNGKLETTLDLTSMAPGIYLLEVQADLGYRFLRKIIVE